MANNNALPRQTLIIDWTFTGLGLLSLVFLFAGRHFSTGILRDDYVILFAWVIGFGLVSQTTWAITKEAQAEHQPEVSWSDLQKAAMSLMVNEALWTAVNTAIRINAGLALLRIFVSGRSPVVLRSIIALCLCHGVASIFEIFLVCHPLAANWSPSSYGQCGNILVSYIVMECVGLFLDLLLLIIPPAVIFGLHIETKGKWRINALFGVGWLLFVVTGLRLHALRLAVSPDYTWSESYLGMLSAVGCMFGVILSSVPTAPALFRKLKQAYISSSFFRALSARSMNSTFAQDGSRVSTDEEAQRGIGMVRIVDQATK